MHSWNVLIFPRPQPKSALPAYERHTRTGIRHALREFGLSPNRPFNAVKWKAA